MFVVAFKQHQSSPEYANSTITGFTEEQKASVLPREAQSLAFALQRRN